MRLTLWAIAACSTVFLSGCVQIRSCDWAEPIFISADDVLTIGTARQILTHNETGDAICRDWR